MDLLQDGNGHELQELIGSLHLVARDYLGGFDPHQLARGQSCREREGHQNSRVAAAQSSTSYYGI